MDSGNFKVWFRGSVVATKSGKPLVMYHRTASDFEKFDTTKGDLGTHFGTAEQALNLHGSEHRDGERTIPVYLSIKNPIRLKDGNFHADAVAPNFSKRN
jgi:ADP-Ribosyltransferase in polyvalent proteins